MKRADDAPCRRCEHRWDQHMHLTGHGRDTHCTATYWRRAYEPGGEVLTACRCRAFVPWRWWQRKPLGTAGG